VADAFDSMLAGYDEVEASQGYSGDPVPTGWYALKLEKVLSAELSKNGIPMVRMQILITEGQRANQRAFVGMTLSASEKDKNGAQRTKQEIDDANRKIMAQMKGFLGALGVSTAAPAGSGAQKVFNFYNVTAWEGRDFIGKISLRAKTEKYEASNQLNAYYNIKDEKHGLDWLRAQGETSGTVSATSTAAPSTI
jgi:hypothetical protein